jgi:hypothetical protein
MVGSIFAHGSNNFRETLSGGSNAMKRMLINGHLLLDLEL